jgi:hypothetical protein
MSNFAGGMASGMMMGYVIGSENEKSRNRRLSNIGSDQLLLKVKCSKDKVGNALKNMYSNWDYKNGVLSRTGELHFSWFGFFIAGGLVGLVLFMAYSLWELSLNYSQSVPSWFNWINSIILTGILSGIFGYYTYDNEISNVQLDESNGYTNVLIKVYDGDGYRNYDKNEISKIVDILENLYAGTNEVTDSIKGQNF